MVVVVNVQAPKDPSSSGISNSKCRNGIYEWNRVLTIDCIPS